jgi:hypothetical protein
VYAQAKRRDVETANPGFTFGLVAQKLADDYSRLDDDSIRVWIDKALAMRKEAREEEDEEEEGDDGSSDRQDAGETEVVAEADKRSSSKKTGIKKKKDPSAPKRPAPMYVAWSNENRGRIMEENPDVAKGDRMKLMSAEWEKVPDEEKRQLKEKHQEQMALYKKEKAAYDAEHEGEAEAEPRKRIGKKRKKTKKDPNAPKRFKNAYMIYSMAHRPRVMEANKDAKQADIMKILAANWKALTEEEKKLWEEKAAADKERYNREMAAYEAKKKAQGEKEMATRLTQDADVDGPSEDEESGSEDVNGRASSVGNSSDDDSESD